VPGTPDPVALTDPRTRPSIGRSGGPPPRPTVLFSGFFYLAVVFAPRMVAEAEGSWRAWLVRYLVFLAATIVSVTFVGAAT